jgi:1-acyl-sn-glycerol-3-phosphate acyltransferase
VPAARLAATIRPVRALVFLLLAPILTGLGFVGTCIGLLFDPAGGRVSHAVARLWAQAMLGVAGVRLVVTGAERFAPHEPRVVVANHCSYLDIPALLVAFPGQMRVVARKSLLWLPFVGQYLWLGGHFLLDREDARQALKVWDHVGARMRRRRISPLVYPEGTRSLDGRMRPFKTGAFLLPLMVEAPVQPVAILGTFAIWPKGAWAPRRWGVVEVRVGAPIPTVGRGGAPARKALAVEAHAAIAALGGPVAAA